ncbi:MAG: DEAD/DEAH box helicase [Candidatus Hydrogenedentes bacterium]|nr:DEAD/DEAH box helicase [Candidatus Hydrogenedentota bacterium]
MNINEIRDALRSVDGVSKQPFAILQSIARVVSNPILESAANELVLRALEHRKYFGDLESLLDALARSVGLFPYVDSEALSFRDSIAYEYHRPLNMADDFVFHREQAEVYRRLLDGDNVILSAPTSFGKSRIIDALIATEKFGNIAIIVPTLALIDETRRRLSQFSRRFKIVTHLSQKPDKKNIFIFTAERAVAYDTFPAIEFFVIDEFYKLSGMSDEETRTVALNQAFYRLKKLGGQFYLLGPNIQRIPDGIEKAYRCYFYPTRFATVVSEQIPVRGKGTDLDRLVQLCKHLHEPTLIFCRSPARVNEVAHALIGGRVGINSDRLKPASQWTSRNYHPDWVFGRALVRGIGMHHGKLPRALAQYVVRKFNELELPFLVCTSTLIEGVNTKAKNVVIFDNKIAREQLDFFTFNNIKGRSGRMFEHFVGHVYLFHEPPEEELPFVDIPVFTQDIDTPNSLLMQIDIDDLAPSSRERMRKYEVQEILPLSVMRANTSIDPDAQIRLARALLIEPEKWSSVLDWNHVPTKEQLRIACDLIWSYLVQAARSKGGVYSARQLAFKIWQMRLVPNPAERVRKELVPGRFSAKSPDEAVERVLEFERTWASFELPRYIMALSRIQQAVLEPLGLRFGDFSYFASQVECHFKNPVAAALDEYGIPLQLGEKLTQMIGETENLDTALARIRKIRINALKLEEFEYELLSDALEFLP